MVKVIVDLPESYIGKLGKIGFKGWASNGYRQDFRYCMMKAVEEFIRKYYQKKEV